MKDRMRNRIVCGTILCSGALCLGATWTWTGPGVDWEDCGNWGGGPDCAAQIPNHPATTNDDVIFVLAATVATATVTIDDMLMARNVEFGGDNAAVLTVDSLLLDANSNVGGVTMTVSGGLTVVANGTN